MSRLDVYILQLLAFVKVGRSRNILTVTAARERATLGLQAKSIRREKCIIICKIHIRINPKLLIRLLFLFGLSSFPLLFHPLLLRIRDRPEDRLQFLLEAFLIIALIRVSYVTTTDETEDKVVPVSSPSNALRFSSAALFSSYHACRCGEAFPPAPVELPAKGIIILIVKSSLFSRICRES